MRKAIINITCFASHGAVMSANGHMITSWFYWITLVLMLVVQVNSSSD